MTYQTNPYNAHTTIEAGSGGDYEQYEMQTRPPTRGALPFRDFLDRVKVAEQLMRELESSIRDIAAEYQRALNSTTGSDSDRLEALIAATQTKNAAILDQLNYLRGDAERTGDPTDRQKKTTQFQRLQGNFKQTTQRFLEEETRYRNENQQQIRRQYLTVNPDASEAEVAEAMNADWSSEGIFATALRSNRQGQARAVAGNIQARHQDLQQIERSMAKLAQLFQQIDTLVVQQDGAIANNEERAIEVTHQLDKGNVQITQGIKYARSRRKLKWWCLGICVTVVLFLAVFLSLYFTVGPGKNTIGKNKNS